MSEEKLLIGVIAGSLMTSAFSLVSNYSLYHNNLLDADDIATCQNVNKILVDSRGNDSHQVSMIDMPYNRYSGILNSKGEFTCQIEGKDGRDYKITYPAPGQPTVK